MKLNDLAIDSDGCCILDVANGTKHQPIPLRSCSSSNCFWMIHTPNVYLGVVNVGIRERAPTQRSHWLLVLLLPLLFYWAHIASIHFPAQFYGQSSAEWVQVGWGCPEIICNEVITVIAWNGKQKLSNIISSFRCIGCWCEENCLRRTYAMASCISRANDYYRWIFDFLDFFL